MFFMHVYFMLNAKMYFLPVNIKIVIVQYKCLC